MFLKEDLLSNVSRLVIGLGSKNWVRLPKIWVAKRFVFLRRVWVRMPKIEPNKSEHDIKSVADCFKNTQL